MSAVKDFLSNNKKLDGSISFLITSDEEGDGTYGTIKMLEHIKDEKPKIDFCILGEPTSKKNIGDTIKIGRRGSVDFILKVKGKQGHVAYPERAINPMPILNKILNELVNKKFDSGTEYFSASNLEITSIDTGNIASNVIPEEVRVKFNIRFNNLHNAEELHKEIDSLISVHSNNYTLEYKSSSAPFIQEYSQRMKKFTKIVEDVCGIQSVVETGGGTSDARFIHKYAEIVEFGLNCDSAHKINEFTKNSDLQALHNVYYNCLVKFLSI
jgi:succinyl-diaminopimelate desuccinylase